MPAPDGPITASVRVGCSRARSSSIPSPDTALVTWTDTPTPATAFASRDDAARSVGQVGLGEHDHRERAALPRDREHPLDPVLDERAVERRTRPRRHRRWPRAPARPSPARRGPSGRWPTSGAPRPRWRRPPADRRRARPSHRWRAPASRPARRDASAYGLARTRPVGGGDQARAAIDPGDAARKVGGDIEQGEAGGDPVVPAVGGQDIGDGGWSDMETPRSGPPSRRLRVGARPGGGQMRTERSTRRRPGHKCSRRHLHDTSLRHTARSGRSVDGKCRALAEPCATSRSSRARTVGQSPGTSRRRPGLSSATAS